MSVLPELSKNYQALGLQWDQVWSIFQSAVGYQYQGLTQMKKLLTEMKDIAMQAQQYAWMEGWWDQAPPRTDQLNLKGGQIMPNTLLHAPPPPHNF